MDIKAQAELRRKRILANAEVRLKKITSRTVERKEATEASEDTLTEVKPSNGSLCNGFCNSPVASLEESIISRNAKEFDSLATTEEIEIQNNDTTSPPIASAIPDFSALNSETRKQSLQYDCFGSLALGVVVNVLIYLGLSWIFLSNVIGPFVIMCIPRLPALFRREPQLIGIISLLTFFKHKQRLILPIKVFCVLRTVSQLFALYIFSFTVTCYIVSIKNS